MNVLNKKMAKRTGAHGAPAAMVVSSVCSSISISKIVDFIEAGPFGSAFLFFYEKKLIDRLGHVQAKLGRDSRLAINFYAAKTAPPSVSS